MDPLVSMVYKRGGGLSISGLSIAGLTLCDTTLCDIGDRQGVVPRGKCKAMKYGTRTIVNGVFNGNNMS
jgi:hypothetical protein